MYIDILETTTIQTEYTNVSKLLTAAEGEQHQSIDEEELDNVYYHPAQGNLKWSEMGVHAEYVD